MTRVLKFIKLSKKGLPAENKHFGNKTITAELVSGSFGGIGGTVKLARTVDIKVFYPATASNSPSKAKAGDPNWFTYYKDAAGGGSYKYDKDGYKGNYRSYAAAGGGENTIRIADDAFGVGEKNSYRLTSTSSGKLKMTGWSSRIYYYRSFVAVLAHEREHANNHVIKGSSGDNDPYTKPDGTQDNGDYLLDSYEISTTLTEPNDPFSATRGTGFNLSYDAEIYAGGPIEEQAYLNASSDTDWASLGGQW